MKVTIIGSGDAFGTGGRAHTCFCIESGGAGVLVDFGASSISSWKKLGFLFDQIDGIVISHLHGDHFGGLPFLLLDCQFIERRTKPLILMGPTGLTERLHAALDAFFPEMRKQTWGFPWRVEELPPGATAKIGGLTLQTFGVLHSPGSRASGLRLTNGAAVFAYSGDTSWTETLNDISAGADLFICECSADEPLVHHMDWPTLKARAPGFTAARIVVNHMGASALARRPEMEKAGLIPAADGQVFEF